MADEVDKAGEVTSITPSKGGRPTKGGRKAKAVEALEETLISTKYRAGDVLREQIAQCLDDLPTELRMSAAQIAWFRLLKIIRDQPDSSLVVEASKVVLDRTFGKAKQQLPEDATGGNTFIVNIR